MKNHKSPLHPTPFRVLRRPLYSALLAASACSLALPAQAVDFFWNGTQSGSWFNGANWTPAGPPAAADNAIIDTIFPNTTLVDNQAATVTDLTVGQTGNGTLQIVNGGSVTNSLGILGEQAGAMGAVTVTGAGSLWDNALLQIGLGGSGTLNIFNDGQVLSGSSTIGVQEGSDGTVLVSGGDWDSGGSLIVGGSGAGTLLLVNSGTVSNTQGRVGQGATGTGHVTVSGMGSVWDNSGGLAVGNQGDGEMFITAGGQVLSASGTVGNLGADAIGLVEVSGMNSNWTIGSGAGNLSVGAQGGTGTMNITDGGAVFSGDGTLGNFSGHGEVSVSGLGSNWILTGDLTVGSRDSGDLLVENQAAISSGNGALGEFEGSQGAAMVTGGAVWNYSDTLDIGDAGSGELIISNGGQLSNAVVGDARIGVQAGSEGAVVVSGAGSSWNTGGGLFTGVEGMGSLTIANSATVDSGFAGIGTLAGSVGEALVTGAGSSWNLSTSLQVGAEAAGNLEISDGGQVNSQISRIGSESTGSGTVVLTDPGSSWNVSGSLSVGHEGSGNLGLGAGTVLNASDNIVVASQPGSQGLIRLDNGTVNVLNGLVVNPPGVIRGPGTINGQVRIEDGATLEPTLDFGSPGTISVNGNLTLESDARLEFELNTPGVVGGGVNSLVEVDGDLTLDGILNVDDGGGFGAGVYTLFTHTGTLNDNGLTISSLPPGFNGVINTAEAGEVRLVVEAAGTPALAISPATLDFGDVQVTTTSAPLVATLSNAGDADLVINALTEPLAPFAGEDSTTTCGELPFTLAPGTSCDFGTVFAPTMVGPAGQTITIDSNAPDSPGNLELIGNGIDLPPPPVEPFPIPALGRPGLLLLTVLLLLCGLCATASRFRAWSGSH